MTTTTVSFKQKIGTLMVYDQQFECAMKIYEIFKRHGGPPLLIAQMQQGKTGTAIIVIDHFIKNCEAEGLSYEVIFLSNIADNVLKDQTDIRLAQAGLSSKVKMIHHADLRANGFKPDLSVQRRLVVMDECQVALKKNQPLHKFFKRIGVNYGESIETWPNKENYILSISATPYAQVIKSKLDARSFEAVVLGLDEKYYSIQHLKESNRLFQSDQVVRNGVITTFFHDRMKEFVSLCETNGNGHMIVRAKGRSPEILSEEIKAHYPNIDIRIFESAPKNNIGKLDDFLSRPMPNPSVLIIRGSLRAGKTLTTTQYIRMWIEPPSSKTDTMCQVVGRCTGFEIIDDRNRRFDDTFPIYCNIREIDLAIKFFDDQKCIPTGIRNSTSNVRAVALEYEPIIIPVSSEEWLALGMVERFALVKNNIPNFSPLWETTNTMTVSKNKSDVVSWVLGGTAIGSSNYQKSKAVMVVAMDGSNGHPSWKEAEEKGLTGKVVVMNVKSGLDELFREEEHPSVSKNQEYDGRLKEDTMFA